MPCRLLSPFALSTLVVTCCVPLGAASSARAQAPGTDPASSPPRGALIVAGGTDAIVRDGDQWTPSAALHLGYELPARRGGLTWRAGVDLWSQGHGDRTVFANGTPVIGSRIGVVPELVEDGVTGLLFTPGDSQELSTKLSWAMTHPAEMATMGKTARERFEKHYTPSNNYEQLQKIYLDAIIASNLKRSIV